MTENLVKSKCFWLLLLLILFPFLIYFLKPAQEIDIFVNYENSNYFGVDYIVEGLDWVMYDGLDNVIASGTTDQFGIINFILKETYDTSGQGIHVEYTWQGELRTLANLEAGTYEIEVETFYVESFLYWADDLSPAEVGDIEVWFDGEYLTTITLAESGGFVNKFNMISSNGAVAGVYTLKGIFDDTTISIPLTQAFRVYEEDILVSAEGYIVSILRESLDLTIYLSNEGKHY